MKVDRWVLLSVLSVVYLLNLVNAGGVNSIPVISQAKSFVEFCAGDEEAARRTQVEFSRVCPGASQVTSLVYACQGNNKEATKIQQECGNAMEGLADGIPVVGHVKGIVHYATGDQTKGDNCMKAASKSTLVLAAGVATGGLGGGVTIAALAGVGVGGTTDAIIGAIDRDANGNYNPQRLIGSMDKISKGKDVITSVFEGIVDAGGNAIGGASGPKLYKGVTKKIDQVKCKNQVTKACKDAMPDATKADIKRCVKTIDKAVKAAENAAADGNITAGAMMDNTGKIDIGFSSRGRAKIARHKFENLGNPDKFATSKAAQDAARGNHHNVPSKLQQTRPDVVSVNGKPIAACAEHAAAEGILGRGNAIHVSAAVRKVPANTNIPTNINPLRRCDNCVQYNNLGRIPTDLLNQDMNLRGMRPNHGAHMAAAGGGIVLKVVTENKINKNRR